MIFRSCGYCGKLYHSRNEKYCSRACHVADPEFANKIRIARKGRRKYKPGAEVIRYLQKQNTIKEVFVKLETPGKWKRKSVIVAESIIGRKLQRTERILFNNGDTLDCSTSNITVYNRERRIIKCPKCGKERVLRNREATSQRTRLCNGCHQAYGTHVKRVLTDEQIGCIKYLLATSIESVRFTSSKIRAWFRIPASYLYMIKCGQTLRRVPVMSSKKAWEVLMQQHDKLAKEGRISLYDRIKLLMQIESNPNFGRNCLQNGCQPVSVLDGKVKDTCANFTELKAMMKLFPKKEQWEGGDIGLMKQQTIQMIQSQKKEEKGESSKTTERVTKAQFQLLKEENARLKQEIEHLKSELSLAKEMIETLKGQAPRKTKRA